MEKIDLKAKPRRQIAPEKLRKSGMIPAIVYGRNIKTENLEVSFAEFEKVFRKAGESTLINLEVESSKPRNVIVQDVQKHYLTGKPQHIDFYEVSMTEKMKATVPLQYVGVSKAVKENAGILVQVLNEVEVECLPADLPHSIEVDISPLVDFDSSIHVKNLNVSDKVKIMAELEDVVATVSPPRDVEAELAQPVVEDVSQVAGAAETPKEGEEGTPAAETQEK